MALINRKTGFAYGKAAIFQGMALGPWKGLQQAKMYPKPRKIKLTQSQRRHMELFEYLTSRFTELPIELSKLWDSWGGYNSDAAYLIEKEMANARHYMEIRKARHKIGGMEAYVMCNMAAYYTGLPLSDNPPGFPQDPTAPPTNLRLDYLLNEKYPDGAVMATFDDPFDVKSGTKKIHRARIFLHFSGSQYLISRQLIGHIELPNNGKPVIIEEIRGQGKLSEKMIKFAKLGKGWIYGILDAVAKREDRAAVPSRYSNPARVRINKDPQGLAKSDKKLARFLKKFPPPKKL